MRSTVLLALLLACTSAMAATEPTAVAAPARAIKPPPAVPPDKAAKPVARIALANAGFESAAVAVLGMPEGWSTVQHAGPKSYTFTPDAAVKRAGERSLRVTNVGPEPYGSIYQTIEAAPYRGRTLRLSAWLRTEATTGNRFGSGAGLKLHAARGGYPVEIAEMRRDAVHGTTDWTRYEIRLKVPAEANQIEAGVSLYGPGSVWIDDVALDVVDEPGPS
jgi:hypothetical protein